jgi:hypothetical protein
MFEFPKLKCAGIRGAKEVAKDQLYNAHNSYFNDDGQYVREKVLYLESEMKKMPQIVITIRHYFSEGVYAREMFVPKGVMLTGKIHKYTQLNILSKGEVSVLIDEEIIKIKAPYTFVAKAGSKRVFLAHEDSTWTVIHGTHETDLEKIEAHFIAETEQEYLEFCGQKSLCLG